MKILITGGSGYLGSELIKFFLNKNFHLLNLDLEKSDISHENLTNLICDVSDKSALEKIFENHKNFDTIIHCAAQLQLTKKNKDLFYGTNIDSTAHLLELCQKNDIKKFIYISSNCVYGMINQLNVGENYTKNPFEEYGKTKLRSEKIIAEFSSQINCITLRPPTIIGKGRLGVLSIVFDFIRENKKLWLVGQGKNRYQFVSNSDICDICHHLLSYDKSAIFNVGTNNIPSLKELFSGVILRAKSRSKIYHFPGWFIIPIMKLAFRFNLSPLGPYQYNMITNSYSGDLSAIKRELDWEPTQNNIEILSDCYDFYNQNYEEIHANKNLVGHKKAAKLGLIKILKWIS